MYKYLSYRIFDNFLPCKKMFTLVFPKQAEKVCFSSEVSNTSNIQKTVPLN